ncbi:MAG: N-acyl homoserine lactonase family protein [Rhizobium sp.]|nr:MAG: N-acyl homoserine lactonase family protein [Rhizobium sp.]
MHPWKALAIHYGTADRPPGDLLLEGGDIHDAFGRIDYFIWLLRHDDRLILVDTGFNAEEGQRRGRTLLIHPLEALRQLGIEAADVTDVIITHLHYDHAGNLGAFPEARFHLQDREMAYGTGRCMCHERMRRPFSVEAVTDAVRLVYADRMRFHDGDHVLAPGISLHLVGGHSRGLQVVRFLSDGKALVLASDALHFSRYIEARDVFPLFADYPEVLEGYDKLLELAGAGGLIVPGHDPDVLKRFGALSDELPFARLLL